MAVSVVMLVLMVVSVVMLVFVLVRHMLISSIVNCWTFYI
jgi:hypothetical protein